MKTLIFILCLVGPHILLAYNCPSTIMESKKAQTLYKWMNRFSTTKTLNGCELEITVCEPLLPANETAPIAEILVKTADQRWAYLSVDVPHQADQRYKTTVKASSRAIYYKKEDRYFEPINGKTEVWQFELRTNWDDKSQLEYLELGLYTTNSQLNQPNGNDSHWFNCWPN